MARKPKLSAGSNANTTGKTPVLPLRDSVHFPGLVNTVHVARDRSLKAVRSALAGTKQLLVLSQRDMNQSEPEGGDLHEIGTLSEVLQAAPFPDGSLRIIVRGLGRARACQMVEVDGVFWAKPQQVAEFEGSSSPPLIAEAREAFLNLAAYSSGVPHEAAESVAHVDRCGELADTMAHYLPIPPSEKQLLLETLSTEKRLEDVYRLVRREAHVYTYRQEIRERTDATIAESQREYVLREQLRCLQKELRSEDNGSTHHLVARTSEAQLPETIAKFAQDQIRRLDSLTPDSPEWAVIQRHLECLLEMPWSEKAAQNTDLDTARAILDKDHAFLGEAKERIVEFLAVRQLTGGARSPVLCFEGPPGVGKTTLAEAVARALGRRFVCVSLGGVRDEAELRGHRRTYVGAHPGRIARGLISCGSSDPVVLLDELDKVSFESGRSDIASALLEILDPSLNRRFLDHYIDFPIDLSDVVFIATANSVAGLPAALKDRLEVVAFPSYSNHDRASIARMYLLPKGLADHGLERSDLDIPDETLRALIQTYTSEAGVRELERAIAAICRRAAKAKVTNQPLERPLSPAGLRAILGQPQPNRAHARAAMTGTVWGLVVAAYGGDAFQIEAAFLKPSGSRRDISLTGNMGDIMRESAEAAVSFLRLHLGGCEAFNDDLHIHAACGDRSKEGPSAGLAIAIAVTSALLDTPTPPDMAFTGEITLRGQVLPVGGIREKIIAAQRLGFKEVLLPMDNLDEARDLPMDVLKDIHLIPVSTADEALGIVFPLIAGNLGSGGTRRDFEHSIKG